MLTRSPFGCSALQAQQHDLEKQQTSDELRKKLDHRPEREELMERKPYAAPVLLVLGEDARLTLQKGNILSSSTAAPALQAQQKELAKHMRQNSLEKQLQARPDAQTLVEQGILKGNEGAVE